MASRTKGTPRERKPHDDPVVATDVYAEIEHRARVSHGLEKLPDVDLDKDAEAKRLAEAVADAHNAYYRGDFSVGGRSMARLFAASAQADKALAAFVSYCERQGYPLQRIPGWTPSSGC